VLLIQDIMPSVCLVVIVNRPRQTAVLKLQRRGSGMRRMCLLSCVLWRGSVTLMPTPHTNCAARTVHERFHGSAHWRDIFSHTQVTTALLLMLLGHIACTQCIDVDVADCYKCHM